MIINMTPHTINVIKDGVEIAKFPPCGEIVRISTTQEYVGDLEGMPMYTVKFGEPVNVPPEIDEVLYIVSAIVKLALPNRKDFISPAEQVRNGDGVVIGCKGFVIG